MDLAKRQETQVMVTVLLTVDFLTNSNGNGMETKNYVLLSIIIIYYVMSGGIQNARLLFKIIKLSIY